jgi:hypothetical protein
MIKTGETMLEVVVTEVLFREVTLNGPIIPVYSL